MYIIEKPIINLIKIMNTIQGVSLKKVSVTIRKSTTLE